MNSIENFKVLGSKILVEVITVEETKDGVYIPNSYEDKPEVGTVIKVGEGYMLDNGTIVPLKVSVGDTVYFNKYSSVKFRIDSKDYYTIREDDIDLYGKRD